MTDLAAWLLDRIAEDEAAARAGREARLPFWVDQIMGRSGSSSASDYVNRFNPGRVVAECDARRRIVAEHRPWTGRQNDAGVYCSTCVGYPIRSRDHIGVAWPCPTLRLLAVPYADGPGWRDEWRP